MHVLICSGQDDVMTFLENVFGFMGHLVSTATDDDILKKVDDTEVDLVMLDLMLPNSEGLDLLKDIKTIKSQLPVVMMSDYAVEEEEAMELGAFDYIYKPLKFDQIKQILDQVEINISSKEKGGE